MQKNLKAPGLASDAIVNPPAIHKIASNLWFLGKRAAI
jgi:hypothetical protein